VKTVLIDPIRYAWEALHRTPMPLEVDPARYRNPGSNKTAKANWAARTRRKAARKAHRTAVPA
jgi:hypothetical protein